MKKIRNIKLLTIISFLFATTFTNAQDNRSLELHIFQQVLPGGIECYYVVKNSQIKVFKINEHNNKILKCSRSLNKSELDTIITYVKYIYDQNYYGRYANDRILDGVNWTFELSLNNQKKYFAISNCYFKPFDDFIKLLNNSLPPRKQYIRLHWFNQGDCE